MACIQYSTMVKNPPQGITATGWLMPMSPYVSARFYQIYGGRVTPSSKKQNKNSLVLIIIFNTTGKKQLIHTPPPPTTYCTSSDNASLAPSAECMTNHLWFHAELLRRSRFNRESTTSSSNCRPSSVSSIRNSCGRGGRTSAYRVSTSLRGLR